ncbi:hypothetical protein [Legionella nagasakiensis]|uniref:hypothetical protein n=1 Tax=Legionella nagasakiensis TaxID=535290 RepID=UPI0010548104|nr:hypothetical protein [Legionella nagasakiensis]
MEQDRYQQNHWTYIIGMICLVVGMTLFAFSAYIFPFLILKGIYDVPEFILRWRYSFQNDYGFDLRGASWAVFLAFFIPALITIIIAYIFSNRIDNRLYNLEERNQEKVERKLEVKETVKILSKIIMIVILVFVIITLFQWLIYVPPVD